MKLKLRAFLIALVLIGNAPAARSQTGDALRTMDFYNGFEGRWEGELRRTPNQVFSPVPRAENAPGTGATIAFSITKAGVQVFSKREGTWHEVKPGNFRFLFAGTNAVLFAITAGGMDDGDGWVETWNFTISHKERDSLNVVMTRSVNNYARPSDYLKKSSDDVYTPGRFFTILYGEMTRPDTTVK